MSRKSLVIVVVATLVGPLLLGAEGCNPSKPADFGTVEEVQIDRAPHGPEYYLKVRHDRGGVTVDGPYFTGAPGACRVGARYPSCKRG